MKTSLKELTVWEGIRNMQVSTTVDTNPIEVTVFGDLEPKYVSGPVETRWSVTLEGKDPVTLERLMAVLQSPPPDRDGDPRPVEPLVVRRVRVIEVD